MFRLDKDDDGHWYVIPVDKSKAFDKWLTAVYDDNADPEPPTWAERVGGSYTLVTFPSYEMDK